MTNPFSTMFSSKNVQIRGSVEKSFQSVQEIFAEHFQRGDEISSQVCVFHKGKKVVDLWASSKDPNYSGDTLQTIWSSTKNLTALSLAMLVDRGMLKYSDPVALHWPEFGQEGKEAITVADVMRHECGMPFFSEQLEIEDSFPENIKENGVGKVIEIQKPSFPAGPLKREYHAISRGFVVQEIFRRVKGRTIGQFLKEEVTDPLNSDVHIGLTEKGQKSKDIADVLLQNEKDVHETATKAGRNDVLAQLKRFCDHMGETEGKRKEHKDTWLSETQVSSDKMKFWNSVSCRQAEVPSAGGLASARGLCGVANMMALGGSVGGRTYLSPAGWREMHDKSTEGETFGMKTFYTQGGINHYKDGRTSHDDKVSPTADGMVHYGQLVPKGMYGWGGYGGSLFLWDPLTQVGFVYIPTYLAWYDRSKARGTSLVMEVYKCLQKIGN